MLSLDQVRDEILELMNSCGADPEKAQAGIQEIFYSLMCADFPSIFRYKKSLSAPVQPQRACRKVYPAHRYILSRTYLAGHPPDKPLGLSGGSLRVRPERGRPLDPYHYPRIALLVFFTDIRRRLLV